MICLYCYYYSKDREECDYNFDTEFDINAYQPPCCLDEEDYEFYDTSYDYIGGIENE